MTRRVQAIFSVSGYQDHKEAHRLFWEMGAHLMWQGIRCFGRPYSKDRWRVEKCIVDLVQNGKKYSIGIEGPVTHVRNLARKLGLQYRTASHV